MTDQLRTRPRRPPPPPPTPPAPPPAMPRAVVAAEGPPKLGAPLNIAPTRQWNPLPWPSLMKDAVPRVQGLEVVEPPYHEHLLNKASSWSGVLTWGFGIIVLLLVVAPTTAIPKLIGPPPQPVSGAAYGPSIAIFAVLTVVVAVGVGLWLWVAMGREYDDPHDPPLPPV